MPTSIAELPDWSAWFTVSHTLVLASVILIALGNDA